MHKKLGFILFLLTLSLPGWCQNIYGTVFTKNVDGDGFRGVSGAGVVLIAGSDTLKTISDPQGRFILKKVPSGEFTLQVTHLSFKAWNRKFKHTQENINVELEPKAEVLGAALVVAGMPLYEFVGDTLKYNVAATQKVGEDDMLGDIVARLPGFSVENGRYSVMGVPLEKVYIDSHLVFGENVSDAMRYLSGEEVVSMKVFDKLRKEESAGLVRNLSKERVLDVHTKHPVYHALIAQAIAGYGRNMVCAGGRTDNRYAASLAANYFSEKTLWSANAYLNNVGRNNEYSSYTRLTGIPRDYSEIGYAGASFSHKFGHGEMADDISASYSFSDNGRYSKGSTERVYTSADRLESSSGGSQDRDNTHHVMFSYSNMKAFIPNVSLDARYSGQSSDRFSRITTAIGMDKTGYGQRAVSDGNDFGVSATLEDLFMAGKVGVSYNLGADFGRSSALSFRADTLVADGTLTKMVSQPTGNHLRLNFLPTFRWALGQSVGLSVSPKVKYCNETTQNLRFRNYIDEANLEGLTSNSYTFKHTDIGLSVCFNKNAISGSPFSASCSVGLDLAIQDNRFIYPYADTRSPSWFLPVFDIGIGYMMGMKGNIFASLSTSGQVPAIEQTTSYINDSNPIHLSSGNPSLRPSRQWRFLQNGMFMPGGGVSLGWTINVGYVSDNVSPVTYSFPSGGDFRGYSVPKGGRVDSWENLSGCWSASAEGQVKAISKKTRVHYDVKLAYSFARDPHYMDDVLNVALVHIPSYRLGLSRQFGEGHSLSLNAGGSMHMTYSTLYDKVSYYSQTVSLTSRNKFAKRFFADATYAFSLRMPLTGGTAALQNHILHAVAGFRFLRGRRGELNLSIYDILGSRDTFSTRTGPDYVQTSFTPNLGRIWMVSFIYRFNSTQKKGSKNVRFGGYTRPLGQDYETWRGYRKMGG